MMGRMRKQVRKFVILTFLLHLTFLLLGCQGLVEEYLIAGRYYLVATDTDEQMALCYLTETENYVGVIPETVFSVGVMNGYILAKQHPFDKRDLTCYYIVPVHEENTYWPEKGVVGPLTKQEFEVKCNAIGIKHPHFSKTFKKLE